jgi:hypothetical protein
VVFDKKDDATKGTVTTAEASVNPVPFPWPLADIEGSITWRGIVVIPKTITVATGGTLRVAPRTRVLFSEGTGLAVKGRIIADGEREGRIYFSSAAKKEPASWEEILLEHADGSSFRHCTIEDATWGIHSHFTRLEVSNTLFRNNTGGIRFRSGPVGIRDSVFSANNVGIRSYRGNASITGNVIAGNETGIFVREKGGGLTIRGNNIAANTGFNIRVGDFNDEDVDARENWWGAGNPLDTIMDGRKEPGIGTVIFEPALKQPVPGLSAELMAP